MSELVPITDLYTYDLAASVTDLVNSNRVELLRRGIVQPLQDYGTDVEHARTNVLSLRGRHEAGELSAFVVTDTDDSVLGIATIEPNRSLIELCAAPFGLMRVDYAHANPYINTWLDWHKRQQLGDIYKTLVAKAVGGGSERPWTLEPATSTPEVHEAIAVSGLTRVAAGLFGGSKTGTQLPMSNLYARLIGERASTADRIIELQTGKI